MDVIVKNSFNPNARSFDANIIRRKKVKIVFELHVHHLRERLYHTMMSVAKRSRE